MINKDIEIYFHLTKLELQNNYLRPVFKAQIKILRNKLQILSENRKFADKLLSCNRANNEYKIDILA